MPSYIPPYGDLVALNTHRDLLDTVGRDLLADVAQGYLALLDTSAAIYEVNGDYATALFTSDYCRLLAQASRRRCDSGDNRAALDSGRWHCHESCWSEASRIAVETGQPFDLRPCRGGINIYAVPIVAEGRAIGALNFGYGTPPTDEATLAEIAARYGVDVAALRRAAAAYQPRSEAVIEAAKHHLHTTAHLIAEMYLRRKASQASQRRAAEAELMQGVHEALSRRAAMGEVLRLVAEGARSLFAGHAVTIYFLSDDGRHLLMQNWALPDGLTSRLEKLTGLDVRHIPLPLVEGGHYWRVIEERRALLLDRPEEIEALVAELASEHPVVGKAVPAIVRSLGYRSVLTAPLMAGGEVVGVMDLGSRQRLGEEDQRRFQLLASQMALAVEKARVEERERKQAARLALVNDISRRAGATLDLDVLLQETVEAIQGSFGYYDVLIVLVDRENDELVRGARAGAYRDKAPPWPRKPIERHQGIIDWVARHGETLLANDVTQEPRYVALFPETKAELCVPICQGDRVLGVLNVECARLAAFEQGDVVAMETLAGQLATAIENARLFQEVQTSRDYFRMVANGLHDQVLIVDRDYRLTDVNAAFLRRTGYTREEVIGRPCYEVSHRHGEPCNTSEHPCPVRRVWDTGQPTRVTHVHYDHEGNEIYIDVAASPLRDAQGRVAQVIEACRDVTAERRLEEKLAAVHELGQELVLTRGEERIIETVLDAAERLLAFKNVAFLLVNEEHDELCVVAGRGFPAEAEASCLPLDGERGITVAVARSGEAIYVPDVTRDARYVNSGFAARSELAVPLKVGGRVIAVLDAESEELNAFDRADEQLLSTLADQAALAIENARLFKAERRRSEELAALNAVTAAVSRFLSLDAVLSEAADRVLEVMGLNDIDIMGGGEHNVADILGG